MSAKDSEASGSFLANPHAWLALVTLAGGLWLVSNKLTSNRPVAPVGSSKGFISDQNVEARLWEDPFKPVAAEGGPETKGNPPSEFATLVAQIEQRAGPSGDGVVLLPVLLPGGQYSEDKEARIRSRFAIISALGVSDYAADDPEHIGNTIVPWPTQHQLAKTLRKKLPADQLAADQLPADPDRLWTSHDEKKPHTGAFDAKDLSTMEVRFEWHHPRAFSPGSANHKDRPNVLVLWLDDTYFENEPLLRLALFMEPLLEKLSAKPASAAQPVRLIGPRRSSTLRAMLPEWGTTTERLAKFPEEIGCLARSVLEQIDVYTATASAMDEVLVKVDRNSNAPPRATVKELLQSQGFHAVYNFAATDAQLAQEIHEELELRGARLKDPKSHVALIYEWDTFYGRMLSLTYAAQVAKPQAAFASSADYVENEIHAPDGRGLAPENFHSFVYLRGLDGQTIGTEGAGKDASDEGRKRSSRPASIEDLTRWSPDPNKAEGQAQFDYLGRLGDRVEQLQQKLRLEDQGRLTAIGIVGSDVYDTLLILQALRQRFPNVLFFTTDLDVRFLHPKEREWARNLIVASSYGLQLHPTLQKTVAPFRDSTQTAQFAATLAAFGAEDVRNLTTIPPRRFEIGNGVAVDLSVTPNDAFPGQSTSLHTDELRRLHPLTTSERDHHVSSRMIWSLVTGILALLGASLMWDRLRRVTWDGWSYPGEALEFSEEDIGGPEGANRLWRWLRARTEKGNAIADWLASDPRLLKITPKLDRVLGKKTTPQPDWAREDTLAELTHCLVGRLNQCYPATVGPETCLNERDECLQQLRREVWANMGPNRAYWAFWPPARAMADRHHVRRFLDAFLERVEASPVPPRTEKKPAPEKQSLVVAGGTSLPGPAGEEPPGTTAVHEAMIDLFLRARPPVEETLEQGVIRAARSARQSAAEIYASRRQYMASFWLSVAVTLVAAGALGLAIWRDAFQNATGEPFSLSNGTSAWPAQIVRLLVFLGAGWCMVRLVRKRREFFSALTRAFRFARPEGAAAGNRASAEVLWFAYRDDCDSGARWGKIFGVVALYFVGLIALYKAQGEEVLNPVRGDLMRTLNIGLVLAALLGLLFLTFLTIDAALRCRGFIKRISEHPTEYPKATRQHFARQQGGRIDERYMDEWMDLQLIAELTEKVSWLVYYPAGLVLLLLLARNSWWDAWSWPESLIVAFVLNFILALASVVILQSAAREAKRKAEESMAGKVKRLKAKDAPSAAANNASQAEKLLEEMRQLRRGAFVPFWENPVVGAVFLSSGGTTLLQVFIWFMNR